MYNPFAMFMGSGFTDASKWSYTRRPKFGCDKSDTETVAQPPRSNADIIKGAFEQRMSEGMASPLGDLDSKSEQARSLRMTVAPFAIGGKNQPKAAAPCAPMPSTYRQ